MAPQPQESGLQLLRALLGLSSPLQAEPSQNHLPIFVSIPHPRKDNPELPLKITILDLLDLSHIPPHQFLSTHTFTTKVPLCWTQPTTSSNPHKMRPIFVTKNILSLAQLLPRKRQLFFVSSGIEPSLKDVLKFLRSLGLNSRMKVSGIFDVEMLAKEVAALGGCCGLPGILQRLRCPMESLGYDTEVIMRAMLLLAIESCKRYVVNGDGRRWLDCVKTVGIGSSGTNWSMDGVRKGVNKVGKAIIGRLKRSAEEIENVRAERRARRQELNGGEDSEEYVTGVRLWDGMWELL